MNTENIIAKKMATSIRFLCADMIEKANSGHPGMPLGMADVASVLFAKYIKINPQKPSWFDRDRFVLSSGHGSALLYSLFYLLGYKDISLDDLKNFRQLKSKTAGHPEYGHLEGIDMTTGPLGQGISSAIGMALAERIINAKFGDDLCNHYTYVMCGDGCLMEGISEEAASLAGLWNLNKLIVFWDNNNITIDGTVNQTSITDQTARFKAMGWNVLSIDGHNYEEISAAIEKAQQSTKPTLIACKTVIGYGAPTKSGTSKVHGSPLGSQELEQMRQNFNWSCDSFEIPSDTLDLWRSAGQKSISLYDSWKQRVAKNQKFCDYINNIFPPHWDCELQKLKEQIIAEKPKLATRKASQMCLEKIVGQIPQLVGGSADLAASNLTFVSGMKTICAEDYNANNIMYGIREHAMGAIMNGLALHGGVVPYGGTFFVFSDYMRPAMRLAALMGLNVTYVLTHDSIGVGEDGPTHQPIEHLASYRAMPNINTFRPCDVIETAEAWECALTQDRTPAILALSRQAVPTLRTEATENLTAKGAYIISPAAQTPVASVIATGTEVSLAVQAQKILAEQNIFINVVSMPCRELFEKQPQAYKNKVLGNSLRVVIEAGATFGWERYASAENIIGIDSFGISAKAEDVYKYFGITVEAIVEKIKNNLK